MMGNKIISGVFWAAMLISTVICFARLEMDRASVGQEALETDVGPATLYRADAGASGPLVIVAHGFAGSARMMQVISRDLARAGFTVAAFDFYGHGRNPKLLSRDVTRITGTTAQLVTQTKRMVAAVQAHTGAAGPVALVGHSMATDIIIRTAQDLPDISALVAISMYSDAVTETFPQNLLIVSGAWEARLRDVAMDAVQQVDAEAREGVTAVNGSIKRRAVSAPGTEHVTVLFSAVTLREMREWLASAFGVSPAGESRSSGWAIAGLLVGVVMLSTRALLSLTKRSTKLQPLPPSRFWGVLIAADLTAFALASWLQGPISGVAGFLGLWVYLAARGVAMTSLLGLFGRQPGRVHILSGLVFLGFALIFAIALDRYAAAFLPVGPRFDLFVAILPAAIVFALGDRLLLAEAAIWRRLAARLSALVCLAGLMVLHTKTFGLLFTLLPVLVLFYVVFGSMGGALARRSGATTAGLALGVCLSWSIAGSLPLFAG